MPGASRKTKSIWDYLSTRFQPEQLDMLYEDTFTVLTIFGSLPPLAKQYVLRLLVVETSVPKDLVDSWVKVGTDSQQAHEYALNRLYEMRVFFKYKEKNKSYLRPNRTFRVTLTRALCTQFAGLESEKASKSPPSIEFLEDFSKTRWESMLYFMVGELTPKPPPLPVQERLERTGLMEKIEGKLVVSSEGFRFLFKGLKAQLWEILVAYMDSVDERKLNRNEVLIFVFRLSFMKLGQGYSVHRLSTDQRIVLQDLEKFGFIWQAAETSSRYYPTSLALALSAAPDQDPQRQGGYVIAEKSFKVYAYTSSAFQRALLGLFCILHFILPNMVVGIITRESVNRAFRIGITAKEIVNYLEQSAHPAMREEAKKVGSLVFVPENVSHQIELWEGEIYRHTEEPASLCEMFKSSAEYVQVRDFLAERKLLLWNSDEKLMLVLREAGLALLKEFRQHQSQPVR